MSIALEICVDSLESAQAANAGGADRIELCRALEYDGLTPPDELIRQVRAAVELDLFVMIRPRAGNFVYSPEEIDKMLVGIERAGSLGADGVVLGALTKDGAVDIAAMRRLVEAARPMQVTFHRAFDVSADLNRSLQQVIEAGADRILTSGAAASAAQATDRIAQLVEAAHGRVCIMAGGGVRHSNARDVVVKTGVREVHTSLGFAVPGNAGQTNNGHKPHAHPNQTGRYLVRREDVSAMRALLNEAAAAGSLQARAC